MSRDPIGFRAGDANLYRYVETRPLDRTDPTGLQSFGEFASNVGQFVWNTVTESAVAITTGASLGPRSVIL